MTRAAAEMDCDLNEDSGIDGTISGAQVSCGYRVYGKYDGYQANRGRKFSGKTKEIKTSDACAVVWTAQNTNWKKQIYIDKTESIANLLFGPEPTAPHSCIRSIFKLPNVMFHTLARLLQTSCPKAAIDNSIFNEYGTLIGNKVSGRKRKKRLAPISVSVSTDFNTCKSAHCTTS